MINHPGRFATRRARLEQRERPFINPKDSQDVAGTVAPLRGWCPFLIPQEYTSLSSARYKFTETRCRAGATACSSPGLSTYRTETITSWRGFRGIRSTRRSYSLSLSFFLSLFLFREILKIDVSMAVRTSSHFEERFRRIFFASCNVYLKSLMVYIAANRISQDVGNVIRASRYQNNAYERARSSAAPSLSMRNLLPK